MSETGSLMNFTINGLSGNKTGVLPNTYDIIATDFDARNEINIAAAYTIPEVRVPNYTITTSITPITPITPGETCRHVCAFL